MAAPDGGLLHRRQRLTYVRRYMRPTPLNKKLQKLLDVSSKTLRSCSKISRMSRLGRGVQRRRMRGRRHASKSARRLMHARQKERVLRSRETARKHHVLPKKERGSSHRDRELKKKQNRGDSAAQSGVVPHEPPSAPAPTHNSCGRKVLQPRKHW